jgi:DNA-binding transcriptional ArsR family regulator
MREILAITKALGDETRLRALLAVKDGELCLCQIIDVLGLSPATVSKHMSILYQAGLVERRKDGKWHYYRIAGGAKSPARGILDWVFAQAATDRTLRDDARRTRRVRRKALGELSACYRS